VCVAGGDARTKFTIAKRMTPPVARQTAFMGYGSVSPLLYTIDMSVTSYDTSELQMLAAHDNILSHP